MTGQGDVQDIDDLARGYGMTGAHQGEDLPGQGSGGHRMVARLAAILELVARSSEGVRLRDICGVISAPKSSVHGLMRGLVAVGYLVEKDKRYVLGPGVGALLWPSGTVLQQIARPELEALARATGETAVLGILVGDNVVYVEQAESSQEIRYNCPLHQRRSLLTRSMGKIFLASMRARQVEGLLDRKKCAGPERERLLGELDEVRRTGLAYNRGETTPGLSAAAAAVRDGDGDVVASVNVAGPSFRLGDILEEAGAEVLKAAAKITARLSTRLP